MKFQLKRIRKFGLIAALCLLLIILLLFLCYKGYIWPNAIFTSRYSVHGIDISHYQDDLNWESITKNKKIRFVYIKATEGNDYRDAYFQRNWEEASKIGLYKGAYHYFTTKSSGTEQAQNYIGVVPVEAGCLPPVIDIEEDGPDKDVFQENLMDFINIIEEQYHQKPILYVVYPLYEEYINFTVSVGFQHGPVVFHLIWIVLPGSKNSPSLGYVMASPRPAG
jgi:lysozyme